MYGQIKLSTCSCVRTDLISIFFTKQLDTCNTFTYMYNVPPKILSDRKLNFYIFSYTTNHNI